MTGEARSFIIYRIFRMKKIILIRGISGSSKSTLANKLIGTHLHSGSSFYVYYNFEADKWFVNESNKYIFDPKEIHSAHRWCQLSVENFLRSYKDCVAVVSNTSTTYKEILPYALLAQKYGAEIEIMEPNNPWSRDVAECYKRNTHNVPLETIQKQLDRLEDNPLECKVYSADELLEILQS